jgi:hypothetical protein
VASLLFDIGCTTDLKPVTVAKTKHEIPAKEATPDSSRAVHSIADDEEWATSAF